MQRPRCVQDTEAVKIGSYRRLQGPLRFVAQFILTTVRIFLRASSRQGQGFQVLTTSAVIPIWEGRYVRACIRLHGRPGVVRIDLPLQISSTWS